VERRVLSIPTDRSYITVEPEQTAGSYTAGLWQKYITALALAGAYVLFYVVVWCILIIVKRSKGALMRRHQTDDFADWRLRQENISKPFSYVFPQMPPRFRRCCAFAKVVFLIQWGGFAVFALGSIILFLPTVVWDMELNRRQTTPVSLGSGSRCVLLPGLPVPLCSQTLLAFSLRWVPVPISCTDVRGHTERERMPVEHKRTAHQICKTEMLPADYSVRLPGVQMQIF